MNTRAAKPWRSFCLVLALAMLPVRAFASPLESWVGVYGGRAAWINLNQGRKFNGRVQLSISKRLDAEQKYSVVVGSNSDPDGLMIFIAIGRGWENAGPLQVSEHSLVIRPTERMPYKAEFTLGSGESGEKVIEGSMEMLDPRMPRRIQLRVSE